MKKPHLLFATWLTAAVLQTFAATFPSNTSNGATTDTSVSSEETRTVDQPSTLQEITPGLNLGLSTNVISENANVGTLTATVSIETPLESSLFVIISNLYPAELSVPSSVTIPAGSTSAVFALSPIQNGDLEGPQVITISIRADGFLPAEAMVTILDDDTPDLRTIAGRVSGTMVTATYLVLGNLTVDTSLTIEPATTLRFQSGYGLVLSGSLLARGEAGREIVFTSAAQQPTRGNWNGITVTSSGAAPSLLDHVEIAYALTGLSVVPPGDQANLVLSHSAVHDCSADGVYVFADRGIQIEAAAVQVLRNRIFRNGRHGISVAAFIYACNKSRNSMTIVGNDVFENLACGINLDAGASEGMGCTQYRRSVIDGLIANNYLHENQYGIHGFSDKGFAKTISKLSSTIHNNLVVNNTLGGIWLDAEAGGELMTLCINNTVAGNGGAGVRHTVNTDLGFTIQNNLVVNNQQGIVATASFSPSPYATAVTRNDVWSNGLNWVNYAADFGNVVVTNAQGTPADIIGNLSDDPLFVASSDYRLRPGSPALDAGSLSLAPTTDREGQIRRGNPDLGCDELGVFLSLQSPPIYDVLPIIVTGARGTTCTIQVTYNFETWTPLMSFTLASESEEVLVPLDPDSPQAYYRVLIQ